MHKKTRRTKILSLAISSVTIGTAIIISTYAHKLPISTKEETTQQKAKNIEKQEGIINEVETMRTEKFAYFAGQEYEEEDIPKRFGYIVEENFIDREIPLIESDFQQLKTGQFFYTEIAKDFGEANSIGIIEVIGLFDGEIMLSRRALGTGMAQTRPYYKIDDNTFIILFFDYESLHSKLNHIEVWDAEGNKLRNIELK